MFVLQIWVNLPDHRAHHKTQIHCIGKPLLIGVEWWWPRTPANQVVPQPILISEKIFTQLLWHKWLAAPSRIYRRHAKGFIKIHRALDLRVQTKWLATPSSIMHNDANRKWICQQSLWFAKSFIFHLDTTKKNTPHLAVQSTLDLGGLCETEPFEAPKGQKIRRDQMGGISWYFDVLFFCFTSGCLQEHTESRSGYIYTLFFRVIAFKPF